MTALVLPSMIDRLAGGVFNFGEDFSEPKGEASLVGPGSVSWRVFANPVTMYIGGMAAVLLELGEPRVRHGVWDHSDFKRDPGRRLRRTGLAAMVTVYGARSRFETLAARVRRMHEAVVGTTPDGEAYAASDIELLGWVQATAAFGFIEAYRTYAAALSQVDRDRYYAEGGAGAALYGVQAPPRDEAAIQAMFEKMAPRLEPSAILDELIDILSHGPVLPLPLRLLQLIAVRAAIDCVPAPLRERLGLAGAEPPRVGERLLLRTLARTAEHVRLASSPREQALRRMDETRQSS